MSNILVAVKGISKSFIGVQAVKQLDMQIKAGEIVALIGPNGAGKSTTMRIITGFLQADKGEVLINNISLTKNPYKCKNNIGYLAEVSGYYSDLTVREYLKFIANAYKLDNISKKITEVSNTARINNFLDKTIEYLSKGMKQRVFLAGSLIHNPEILILDEPTEGLDPNQKQEMYALLKKLANDDKKAILLSTHALEEAENICTRVIVMHNGEVVADEKPQKFKKRGGNMNKSFSQLTVKESK